MEQITKDNLDHIMVSKENNAMVAGSVYLYDVYAKPESDNVKLHYTKIPFPIIERILDRPINIKGINDKINEGDISYTYLVYRESEDLSIEDEENLMRCFTRTLEEIFKRKLGCKSCHWIRLNTYPKSISGFNETIFVFILKMEDKNEEISNAMEQEEKSTN